MKIRLQAIARFLSLSVLAFLFMTGAGLAADICTGQGQILIPGGANGTCLQGYYGAKVSNCLAVPNALSVTTAEGGLTCISGPSCPSGYAQNLPPVVGAPANQSNSPGICQAVCSPLFASHGWPCSCPYGQHLNGQTQQCTVTCGGGAAWQHSSDYQTKHPFANAQNLYPDAGVCTCPAGQEYVSAQSACMVPCPQSQVRDGSGKCYAPYNGGSSPVKICTSGQPVKSCQCPTGGIVKNGLCIICAIAGPNGAGTPNQDPACKNANTGGNEGDGYHPIAPTQLGTCLPGTHWNGLKCVANAPSAPSCPSGTHWGGSACVSNATLTATCPTGTRAVDGACVPVPIGTRPVCTADQHWDGRTCIPNGCSRRQHWDGRTCVAN